MEDAGRVVRRSAPAVSRWERAESAFSPADLRDLLRHYGVERRHADHLVQSLPHKSYVRSQDEALGPNRAPVDYWGDVAGAEALARYIAVMRMASEIIEYAPQVPAGLRTQAYQQVVLDPASCLRTDEPVLGLPAWVHDVPWAEGQQRTVLLDETVLMRPVGGPQVMAHQLRHLAGLMEGERADSGELVIRILPADLALFIHTLSWPAEVILHGHRLAMSFALFPCYETGSRAARRVSAGLREALSRACDREETYQMLVRAAQAMERRRRPHSA